MLTQGDNQVINTLSDKLTESELAVALQQIYQNNQEIMAAVIRGTKRLGLQLNREDTMASSEYLNYGKVLVIRGKIYPLEYKW